MELQIGDVIEEFNYTGSSDRATLKTYIVESVTKTIAKSGQRRFKRIIENYTSNGIEYFPVRKLDNASGISVLAHRLQIKK